MRKKGLTIWMTSPTILTQHPDERGDEESTRNQQRRDQSKHPKQTPADNTCAECVVSLSRDTSVHTVKSLESIVEETLASNDLDRSALDWLIPHQANIRIIQATAKRLKMPMDKVVLTVQKYGNTSAASVPMALDVAVRDGRVERGQLLLLEAFGGGLTWGSALLRY